MSAPRTIELDLLEDQVIRLQAIVGGTAWNTRIGEHVEYEPIRMPNPPLHVAPSRVAADPTDHRNGARISIEWRAVVPLEEFGDSREALRVLADLRAALLCTSGITYRHEGSDITLREDGSNYAIVRLTVSAVGAV
jgi:hypothetical protein